MGASFVLAWFGDMSLQKGELGILRDSGITFIEKTENPPNAPELDQMGYKAFRKFEIN